MANIGKAPNDHQLTMAENVLSRLVATGALKTYKVSLNDMPGKPRVLTVQWSTLLQFPSQNFSIVVPSMTEENFAVSEVMET